MEPPGNRGRLRAAWVTAAVVTAPGLAIVWLHYLGRRQWMRVDWSDPTGWLARVPLEDAVVTVLRLVGLAGAYWLLASTLGYLAARISGSARLIDATSALTLPPIRRIADRLVAGTIVVSTIGAPVLGWAVDRPPPRPVPAEMPIATAPEARPSLEPVVPGYLPPGRADRPPPTAEPPAVDPVVASTSIQDGGAPSPDPAAIPLAETERAVVRPGDHLWNLAAGRLEAHLRRSPADHETAPYWARLVEANRDHLRSGDPDLIYPGEVVVFPPLEQ